MRLAQTDRPSNRVEVLIGRTLAMCAHPVVAWRTQARGARALMLATYFTTGYLAVLAALTFFA
jgi:hypothetical protein